MYELRVSSILTDTGADLKMSLWVSAHPPKQQFSLDILENKRILESKRMTFPPAIRHFNSISICFFFKFHTQTAVFLFSLSITCKKRIKNIDLESKNTYAGYFYIHLKIVYPSRYFIKIFMSFFSFLY